MARGRAAASSPNGVQAPGEDESLVSLWARLVCCAKYLIIKAHRLISVVDRSPTSALTCDSLKTILALRDVCLLLAVGTVVVLASGSLGARGQQPSGAAPVGPSPAAATDQRALLNKYCVTCHNTRLKTAGLSLDAL